MSRRTERLRTAGALLLFFTIHIDSYAQQSRVPGTTPLTQMFPLTSTRDLEEHDVKLQAVEYSGRQAVRVDIAGKTEGLALLRGMEFEDGTIEADVAVKVTTPPNVRNPGFIGIAFRAQADASHYEMFYIRPGNSVAPDQAMRNHSVQYVAKPGFDWYTLRRAWPWTYEAYAELQPEMWTRLKIEVEGRRARLYVNGGANPALVVDGLKGEDLKGGVGLWASSGQENYFSNVRVTHAKSQSIENGGTPDGTWEIKYATDAGDFSGVLTLHRDGGSISGTSSGQLGTDLPVTGKWRNGYLELAFSGTLTSPSGASVPAATKIAGWIDGNTAKGRVSVGGRGDGVWTATRRESPNSDKRTAASVAELHGNAARQYRRSVRSSVIGVKDAAASSQLEVTIR